METIAGMSSNKYKKLFSNTLILTVGTFGSKLLVLLMLPLYTGILSTAEYGVADLIAQCSNFLIPLFALGLYKGVFRFTADNTHDETACFSTGVILTLAGTAAFLLLSPLLWLVDAFHGYAWLIVLYVTAAIWHYLLAQFVRGRDQSRLFAFQGILNTVVTVTLNVLFLVAFRMGVVGYVLSVVIGDTVTSVFLLFSAKIYRVFSFSRWNGSLARDLIRYSLPLIPADLFWWVTDLSDRFLVTYICGEEINGIYAVAYKIPTLITLVSGVFSEAWQYSAVNESGNVSEYRAFFAKVYCGFSSVMFLAGSGLIWLNQWLCSWLFAPDYYTAWESVPWLLLATVFTSLVTFLGTKYMVDLRSVRSMWTAAVGALLNVVLNLFLIPRFGAVGAAAATFASYLCVYCFRAYHVARDSISVSVLRTVLNTVFLLGQTFLLSAQVPHVFLWEAGFVVLTAIFNARPLLMAVNDVISSFRRRRSV